MNSKEIRDLIIAMTGVLAAFIVYASLFDLVLAQIIFADYTFLLTFALAIILTLALARRRH